MGRLGDCSICRHRDRRAIDAGHARKMSIRALAREFSASETSLRRHFAHSRAKPEPRPKPTPEPEGGVITFTWAKKIAAETGIPLADVLYHVVECRNGGIDTQSAEEEAEYRAAMASIEYRPACGHEECV